MTLSGGGRGGVEIGDAAMGLKATTQGAFVFAYAPRGLHYGRACALTWCGSVLRGVKWVRWAGRSSIRQAQWSYRWQTKQPSSASSSPSCSTSLSIRDWVLA